MNRHPNPHSDNKGPHSVEKNEHRTLIKNISIFNGTSQDLIKGQDVVLLDNTIEKIIPAGAKEDGYGHVIDGKGGYLSPGLIDNHLHLMMGVSQAEFFNGPFQHVPWMAIRETETCSCAGLLPAVMWVAMSLDRGKRSTKGSYPARGSMGRAV